MKKSTKIILSILGLGINTACIIFYLATRKPATSEDSAPIATYESTQLIQELDTDSTVAKKIMEKNIAVNGMVKEVKTMDHSVILDAGEAAYIICSFDSIAFETCKPSFKEGQKTSIKGIFYNYSKTEDDGMGLIPAEKNANLKTCFIHTNK